MRRIATILLTVVAVIGLLGTIIHFRRADSVADSRQDTTPSTRVTESPDDTLTLHQQCVERSQRLRRQLDAGYAVSIHPPFVLAGGPEVDLQHQYDTVIQPACQILNQRFFDRPPDRPLRILLHSNETAYRSSAERLFFDRDISRFGYFKPGRHVVLVNLAEGQAALRHELVHALMHFDFPDAPPWLQEGLATLFEAVDCSADATGQRWESVPSWRLDVLQRELKTTRTPDLRQLVRAADLEGPGEAVAYAQARYLCMYLHHLGHLESVYRDVRENATVDPHGERALTAAFPGHSWSDLEGQFRHWVLSLCQ